MNPHPADELDVFLSSARAVRPLPPPGPEAAFAAEVQRAADELRPDPAFVAVLRTRFRAEAAAHDPAPVRSHRRSALPLAFGLAAAMLLMAVIWLAPPRSSGVFLQSLTPTPEPAPPRPALGGVSADWSEAMFERLRAANIEWLGLSLRPQLNDGMDPIHTLGIAEMLITSAQRGGFRILITASARHFEPDPGSERAYAEWVAGLARLGPDAIQIWNSPNSAFIRQMTAEQYSALLRRSVRVIKRANPAVSVISASLLDIPEEQRSLIPLEQFIPAWPYYEALVEAGLPEDLDCIGVNFAPSPGVPAALDHPSQSLPALLERMDALFGASGKPLCFTGLSIPSRAQAATVSEEQENRFTPATEATGTVEALRLLRAHPGLPTRLVILGIRSPQSHIGRIIPDSIIQPDGTCLLCDALAAWQAGP